MKPVYAEHCCLETASRNRFAPVSGAPLVYAEHCCLETLHDCEPTWFHGYNVVYAEHCCLETPALSSSQCTVLAFDDQTQKSLYILSK